MIQRQDSYREFLEGKRQLGGASGFSPIWMPDFLFDFQKMLTGWAIESGRGALFADCGLGKTPMQLVWAENVVRKTNKPVLILAPIAVGAQTKREGEKFGVDCVRSSDGKIPNGKKIIVTNYERLHYFQSKDFIGAVCDESSILKNFDGRTKSLVTEFMREMPYRLLCTATSAPNDYVELGTSSEALGQMGYMDMLSRFFRQQDNSLHPHNTAYAGAFRHAKWRFRGHAEHDFWRWVCSWARAVRYPSDLGFDDDGFILPKLETHQHVIQASRPRDGVLFDMPAITLHEQREERRRTLPERCEKAAALVMDTSEPAVMWCHLNDEGDRLARIVPGAVQVSGKDSDERKEEVFCAFQDGEIRVLVTKPRIGGFGLNWQHCAHQTFFPSHSFEQWYQAIRRSWRFGQEREVLIDVITSEGEAKVLSNLQRKAHAAEEMFKRLVSLMNDELHIQRDDKFTKGVEVPQWL